MRKIDSEFFSVAEGCITQTDIDMTCDPLRSAGSSSDVRHLPPIYYLTGMNGRLDKGLGRKLTDLGLDVIGRQLTGDFQKLRFHEQVDMVANDLVGALWNREARVIANSFGAYIFLHAQAQLSPYVGKVLLLSPIVGSFSDEQQLIGFVPPRSDRLRALAESGIYPTPEACEIHVGSEDWQSNPGAVKRLGDLLRLKVSVVEGAGHVLPQNYVAYVLDDWLRR